MNHATQLGNMCVGPDAFIWVRSLNRTGHETCKLPLLLDLHKHNNRICDNFMALLKRPVSENGNVGKSFTAIPPWCGAQGYLSMFMHVRSTRNVAAQLRKPVCLSLWGNPVRSPRPPCHSQNQTLFLTRNPHCPPRA